MLTLKIEYMNLLIEGIDNLNILYDLIQKIMKKAYDLDKLFKV